MSLLYSYHIYIIVLLKSEFHPQIGILKFSGRIFFCMRENRWLAIEIPLIRTVLGLSILNNLHLDGVD